MCFLEKISHPQTIENEERREIALATLCELLRKGLEHEASCATREWSDFYTMCKDTSIFKGCIQWSQSEDSDIPFK